MLLISKYLLFWRERTWKTGKFPQCSPCQIAPVFWSNDSRLYEKTRPLRFVHMRSIRKITTTIGAPLAHQIIAQKWQLPDEDEVKTIKSDIESFFSGSRGPHGPDLPSPFGRKFQISHSPSSDILKLWSELGHVAHRRLKGPRNVPSTCFDDG